uniref:Uncharacterized protein n=1 Tax=Vannella robusta TaxID=1487602 RepID=A0A7S4HHA2_9EUKA|mmetsp:Transcript_10421/g.12851  ORF Transcript_10421/g.12851 Transcript_10421/m.12851 type:complete len:409 (+) Transcript_10421:48-1274(+)
MFGRRPSGPVDSETFYKRLGVEQSSSPSVIKKAYYKKAKDCHPDKFPDDPEKLKQFQELSHAYEVLSDPEKRQTYDQFGEEGLNGGGGGGASSIFEHFFGGGFGGGRPRGPPKGEDIAFRLGVTLEDMYNGTKKKLKVNKKVICATCSGKGSEKEGATKRCQACRGQGIRLVRRQMGHNIIQMQAECDECDGRGESIDPKDKCKECRGRKVLSESKVIEVEIDRGMREGQKITFAEEGDQAPGIIPGDIVVVIQEKESDANFVRRGDDLIYEAEIQLIEALTGFQFLIKHLDGRSLLVKSSPGGVTKENDIKVIDGEGMPRHRNPFQKGSLFVHFTIKWPEPNSITPEQSKLLEKVFPSKPTVDKVPEDCEVVSLEDYNEDRHEQQQHYSREAYDEDDEEPSAGCVHQ